MNRFSLLAGLIASVTFVLWSSATGADDAAPPADAAAQAKVVFEQRFAAYKDSFRQVEHLRTEYQTANEPARARINAELAQRIAAMQASVDSLVAAAIDVYRLAPRDNPEITDLLVAVARHDVVGQELTTPDNQTTGGDRYEHALPIIKLLVDNGAERRELPVWGFVCAAATSDYDLADAYLKMARQSGALTDDSLYSDATGGRLRSLALGLADSLDTEREKWAKESAIRAAEAEADNLPRVRVSTTKGDITLELFEDQAPQAVASFITLARQGFYDGVPFHRVIPGFMAQSGDPRGDGSGGPDYSIRCECYEPDARMHFRGSLSMAHRGRDTGGSQFFITFVPTPHLDGKHTVFGRVIEGIDVLAELQRREPTGDRARDASLPKPDRILRTEVLRDRGHQYTFDRLPVAR